MKKLFFALTILFGCYISGAQCVKEPEKILLYGDGPVYAPGSIQLIENSNAQLMHYEFGQSNVFTTVNGVTKETLIYFEATLLLAYYDSALRQYYFVGSIGGNEGYIAVFDEWFQLIDSNEYADQRFFSATVFENEIIVGSEYKLFKIDMQSLKIKDKVKIDISTVWCINTNNTNLICGGTSGGLFMIKNGKSNKITGTDAKETFYDIKIYQNNFLVISGENLNLISENGEFKGRLELNDDISAHFIDSLNKQIVLVGRNGTMQYYNINEFTLVCETSIEGFELKEEPIEVIIPVTDNNYSVIESRNIFNTNNYKTYNSKFRINDITLDKNEDLFTGNAAGELFLFDTIFKKLNFYKYKNGSALGLTAGGRWDFYFAWFSDGVEMQFLNNKFDFGQKLYGFGGLKQTEFSADCKSLIQVRIGGDSISLVNRIPFNFYRHANLFRRYDEFTATVNLLDLNVVLVKIHPGNKQCLGYLFDTGVLEISDFINEKQKICSISGIIDFEKYKKGWIALNENGKLISITEKGVQDHILTSNLLQAYKIAVSRNNKYLAITNNSTIVVYEMENNSIVCEYKTMDSVKLESIEITNDGYVFSLLSNFPESYIQPSGPKRYETRFISNVSFDERTRYMYVFDSFGLLEVYQL
ncbi:MAG: hypothetical protein IPH42_12755 [Bacteroidetes bacterium]|jgi:hypothetical protein|nr:hypothetical protein [Bacteroidota bacterium]